MLGEFAQRFTGSPDLYQNDYRKPTASINFVTAHDGFTLHDLVSYNGKHNLENGENNNDGESHNRSWNCGAEGPTDDPEINKLRLQQKRNFLATLFLSQGVPMLLGGDELGRTQGGNKNGYCQDNELSWFNWDDLDEELLEYTRSLIRFRHEHPVFRRRRWFQGTHVWGAEFPEIHWFKPDGTEMLPEDWDNGYAKSLGVFLNGQAIPSPDQRGERIVDDSFLLLFNAHHEPLEFTLPDMPTCSRWRRVLDSADLRPADSDDQPVFDAGSAVGVAERCLAVLQCVRDDDAEED